LKGTVADRLTKVFSVAGLTYNAVELPNRRLRLLSEQKDIDFAVAIPTFLNDTELYLRSKEPLGTIKLQVVSETEHKNINSIADIKGRELIIISGYSYGGKIDLLKNRREFIVSTMVESHKAGIKALKAGRGKFFLGYKLPISMIEQKLQLKKALFKYQIDEIPMYLYLDKQTPDAQKVMKKINQAHAELLKAS
jgi:ABC-type amino acid transport substrate-binding protein